MPKAKTDRTVMIQLRVKTSLLEAMDKFVNDNYGDYASRSELVRIAVAEFLGNPKLSEMNQVGRPFETQKGDP